MAHVKPYHHVQQLCYCTSKCFPFHAPSLAHFLLPMSAICFLKDISSYDTFKHNYISIQYTGYSQWIRIVLLSFVCIVFFHQRLLHFFEFPSRKRVLLRRGGKGTINPWWPPHKKTKQNPSPLLPFFLLQCHLVRPSSHMLF